MCEKVTSGKPVDNLITFTQRFRFGYYRFFKRLDFKLHLSGLSIQVWPFSCFFMGPH